ncbi:MAG: hypothetical protein K0U78_14910 [Actinomycetia bacterium]|nr:hypothetical protein [Actinomycetes bacterium]
MKIDIKSLLDMRSNKITNYIVPGLSSSLIGGIGENGTVRLFESERDQQEHITPHSHRFNFQCIVLEGVVQNSIWVEQRGELAGKNSDQFQSSTLTYGKEVGVYEKKTKGRSYYDCFTNIYKTGDVYHMNHRQIHSIKFGRRTKVLFFEGKTITDKTTIIEPVVDDIHIPTFKVENWMFKKSK